MFLLYIAYAPFPFAKVGERDEPVDKDVSQSDVSPNDVSQSQLDSSTQSDTDQNYAVEEGAAAVTATAGVQGDNAADDTKYVPINPVVRAFLDRFKSDDADERGVEDKLAYLSTKSNRFILDLSPKVGHYWTDGACML